MKSIIQRIFKRIQLFINTKRGVPQIINYHPNGKYEPTHISAFSYANAGDTILPVVLRDLFNRFVGVKKWHDYDVHRFVDSKAIKEFNSTDFIVIGGGGLFLADTCPNDVSGWQWNCDIEALNRIERPIIAFALGYNRFRGQEEFKPIFKTHLRNFVARSIFVGIRNHGSIEKLSGYLEEPLRKKLRFQPCMTTMISKIYPNLQNYKDKEDFIAINCAFDRKDLRSSSNDYLVSIAKVAKELAKITKIKIYSHLESDKNILPYLDSQGVDYELVELVKVRDILKRYSEPRLVIGMRGHAQMIPFGCLTPIVSIVSHDKMKWFLADIDHEDWGVDVEEDDFEQKLLSIARQGYDNYEERILAIEKAQEELWKVTTNNLTEIKSLINKYNQ